MEAHTFATLHILNSKHISPIPIEIGTNRSKLKMTIDRFSNIAYLSNDIWVALTIKVTSNSICDLCSLKMTCKAARDAGNADIVHHIVYIPPPYARPWWWSINTEARRFFDCCMAKGHPELLFQEALRELFMRRNEDVGLRMLKIATSRGHEAAKYALSMTLLLRMDDDEAKRKRLQLYRQLAVAGLLTDCNTRCFSILSLSWPGEVQMPHIEEQQTVCATPRCSTRGYMGLLYDYHRRAADRNSIHAFGRAAHIPASTIAQTTSC
ncbi:uncharacterized protein LOC107457995 [Arachis duranensis]|uniref:Uncharacterized protein LOC107457995 n=1 Tax=Arachis duranensis TaxID=130453 RepID=A0A6P4BVE9_ARADU|nr:uncharacterized protein LOC107457995 [Arachis duranensis]